jgi:hypothetical protein
MPSFDIHTGQDYGYRDHPKRRDELQRVKVLEKVRAKWKVEWVEPNPGLQDYVKSVQLVVPWGKRRAFLKDEENWDLLVEACSRSWPGHDHPLSEAVDLIIDSTGEPGICVGNHGELTSRADTLGRVLQRSNLELVLEKPAFRGSDGELRLPFDSAVTLARAFAAAEPQTVLLEVETSERRYEQEAREIGNWHFVPLVQRWRAGWALCRQWAGFDEGLAQRDREIERLRRIIDDFGHELRRSGQDELAARLQRKVGC